MRVVRVVPFILKVVEGPIPHFCCHVLQLFILPSGEVSPVLRNKSPSHLPGETRALLSALCHVPWAIFNPAVTTTAKPNTAAYWAAAEVGGVCVHAWVYALVCAW